MRLMRISQHRPRRGIRVSYPRAVDKAVKTRRLMARRYLTKRAIFSLYLKIIFSIFNKKIINKKIINKILKRTNAIILITVILTLFGAVYKAEGASEIEWLKVYAHSQLLNSHEFYCLDLLWTHESHWNRHARNKKSTAYGIPQLLDLKTSDPIAQINLGLKYIKHRYSTPCRAWTHWQKVGSY